MADAFEGLTPGRLAALGRAAIEQRRSRAARRESLLDAWRAARDRLAEGRRSLRPEDLAGLLPAPGGGGAAGERSPVAPAAPLQDLLRQRAALELELQSERQRSSELQAALRQARDDQRQAAESLALQQDRLKDLQSERSGLLSELGRLESALRRQINQTEQLESKYHKLSSARRAREEAASARVEQMAGLQAENQRLHQELEAARQRLDAALAAAQTRAAAAAAATPAALLGRIWRHLGAEIPEVFSETHVPGERTFESLCAALLEFVRTAAVMELHVHHMLRDLRQVSEQADKLNHFYIMFTRNPRLLETLRDYLTSGKRKGNFANLLRAQQAWARAFGSGSYKAIVRSPVLIGEELNYRSWPVKAGFTVSAEAAIGKHYKEVVYRTAPERLGTRLRKHAAEMAYEDYNTLMKRQR